MDKINFLQALQCSIANDKYLAFCKTISSFSTTFSTSAAVKHSVSRIHFLADLLHPLRIFTIYLIDYFFTN